MTRIVDGLESLGLAERRPSTSDRRSVAVAATQAGENLMRAAQQRRIEAIAAAFAALSASDQRRLAAAAGLLDKLAHSIKDAGC